MLDQRDPEIRALMVELGMSAEDAPSWQEIESRASRAGQAAPPVLRRSVPGWAVAVATAVVALVSIGGTLLLVGSQSEVAETPSTLATTTVPVTTALPVTTTAAPPSTASVEALVEEYYAAYNGGDAARASELLSPLMRRTSLSDLRFRVDELGERVEARCIPASGYPGAIVCSESYTDPLHGAAGLELHTSFLYTERNGVLIQTAEPGSTNIYEGCLNNRCPDQYDEFAADLFNWLRSTRPSVADRIGDAARLNYFAADGEAIAAALPFAAEFVAQSSDWGGSATPAIAGLEPLEAVEAYYATFNSRDPAVYRSFFGVPPDPGTLWFWELGTISEAQCEAVPGDDTLVRCEESWFDDLFSKVGAEFRYGTLWSVADGGMISTTEWEMISYWAWSDFERDFSDWMRSVYPDDHRIAFGGSDLARTPEAAAIAVTRIDEFIDQSPDYPRSPDPVNQISTETG